MEKFFANISTMFINKAGKSEYEPSVPLSNFVKVQKQFNLLLRFISLVGLMSF